MPDIKLQISPLANDSMPTTMINLLSNKGFCKEWIYGIDSLNVLEQKILGLIEQYQGAKRERLRIFHLIQTWGGYSGRNIYLNPKEGFDWAAIDNHYKILIEECRSISDHSKESIEKIIKAINVFNNSVPNIGLPYITKHTRFWLFNGNGNNMLPIFDSVMANGYMNNKNISLSRLRLYWEKIVKEADDKKISLAEYERILFNRIKHELEAKRKETAKQ